MEGEKLLFESKADNTHHHGKSKQDFKLFIKASQIDKETRGSCPVCQQWFMVAYLIAQKQDGVNFSVYTVQESCPPKEFDGWSKKFPVVLPVDCVDKKGDTIAGGLYDNFEDLEQFFEAINSICPELKRHNIENSEAVSRIDTLYATFNQWLTGQPEAKMVKALWALNSELESHDKKLFIDDELCFVDCVLLPRLQHIKVAGKRYNDFNIPLKCKAVWRYLSEAYKQPAFRDTMPSDQDIVNHYAKKATAFRQVKNVTTEKFTYDTYIPDEILEELNGDVHPGQQQEEQEQEQQQEEQQEEQQWEQEPSKEFEPDHEMVQQDNNGLDQMDDSGVNSDH